MVSTEIGGWSNIKKGSRRRKRVTQATSRRLHGASMIQAAMMTVTTEFADRGHGTPQAVRSAASSGLALSGRFSEAGRSGASRAIGAVPSEG
jgi:hypothetical protein